MSITRWMARMSLAKLEAWCDKTNAATKWDIESACASSAIKMARFSAYITTRIHGHPHAKAVASQNRVAKLVRRALGYTHQDDISF